jgi:alpha-ketoglutarate-dependent taurine dioxygenase
VADQGQLTVQSEIDDRVVLDSLKSDGVVLVRNPDTSVEDFEALSDALMMPMVHQATGTMERDQVNEEGTTSTVNNGRDYIPHHREGSYAPGSPHLLVFYCQTPASEGGQTILCDGVGLRDGLSKDVRSFVDEIRLKWSWNANPDRWQATLGTADKEEAQSRLATLREHLPAGDSIEAEFDGDVLHGVFLTPCITPTPWGGHRTFCNSVLIYFYRPGTEYWARPFDLHLEDDQPFPQDALHEIYDVANRLTEEVNWETGDIAVVDNRRFMHGRRSFEDPERRVLARMGFMHPDQS